MGLRVYNSKRYTIDLDAVMNSKKSKEQLSILREAIESDIHDGVWFKLEREESLPLQTSRGGIKQVYRVGLGEVPENLSKASVVHFDIGFDDVIIPDPIDIKTSFILGEGDLSWKVYSIETIIAEKLHAFIFREGGSSRAKDLYDLSFYLPQASENILRLAINACFKHRKTEIPKSIYETMKSYDFFLVKKSWNKVSSVVLQGPEFETCLQKVLQNLKKMNL